MNIELHIEELVLHGFPEKDRYAIAEAVERELSLIFSERGVPSSLVNGGTIPSLQGGAFNVSPKATPAAVGQQVARAVYGGMAT